MGGRIDQHAQYNNANSPEIKKNTTQSNSYFYMFCTNINYTLISQTHICSRFDLGNTLSLKHRKRTVIYQKWLEIKKNRIYSSYNALYNVYNTMHARSVIPLYIELHSI